jgi:hypothetical protein
MDRLDYYYPDFMHLDWVNIVIGALAILLGIFAIALRGPIADWNNAHVPQTWSPSTPSRIAIVGSFMLAIGLFFLLGSNS